MLPQIMCASALPGKTGNTKIAFFHSMCCTQLAGNAGHKKSPKIRHLGTIAQLCRAISSQLRHISIIGKKLVKQRCLPHMSSHYGEPRPTSGWDLLASLGHPCKFQQVSRLGSVTARHSGSWRQPNFASLNRGHHLYSAGRPSRWALARISSCSSFRSLLTIYCIMQTFFSTDICKV